MFPTNLGMTGISDAIELVGNSEKRWENAAKVALEESVKTIRGITGIEAVGETANVDPKTGQITAHHTTVKMAFRVERT
jgi:flavin-binding protein dodecin